MTIERYILKAYEAGAANSNLITAQDKGIVWQYYGSFASEDLAKTHACEQAAKGLLTCIERTTYEI